MTAYFVTTYAEATTPGGIRILERIRTYYFVQEHSRDRLAKMLTSRPKPWHSISTGTVNVKPNFWYRYQLSIADMDLEAMRETPINPGLR